MGVSDKYGESGWVVVVGGICGWWCVWLGVGVVGKVGVGGGGGGGWGGGGLFFFKQKTAYEILRSDWSSDVCSSD
eukprot:COSAG02_NODE_50374_length_320_cov_0.463964_1_plen_74_part_01